MASSMQQPDPSKQQLGRDLHFTFIIGSKDPAPAGSAGDAFCLGCGHRHGSKSRWQPGTVRLNENRVVEVMASGRTALSAGTEYGDKQRAVLFSLSACTSHILELQNKCKPGEQVYPKLAGRYKTAVCTKSYQKLTDVHAQRPRSRPRAAVPGPSSSQVLPPDLRSGVQLRQQLDAEKLQHEQARNMLAAEQQQHEQARNMLAAEQQQHAATRQELIKSQRHFEELSAKAERLLWQLGYYEAQNAQLQQQQEAVAGDIAQQSQQHQQLQQCLDDDAQAQQEIPDVQGWTTRSNKRSAEPVVPQSTQPAKRMSTCASRRAEC